MTVKKEDIIERLRVVTDSQSGQDIVSARIISSVIIKGNTVGFALEAGDRDNVLMEGLRRRCEEEVRKISGVEKVTVVVTSSSNMLKKPSAPEKKQPLAISGIKKIIAVAAGKGGVGKSTISVNLAVSLAKAGYRVGIVDADIYGPSIPKMMGAHGKPEINADKKMVPLQKYGVSVVSIGNIVDSATATVWRGPMATKALYQLLMGVAWGNLDYLIVDMPPGTGDIQLSLTGNFKVDGAVMVSTPQEVALADVAKAVDMFRKVNVPIIGLVSNMAYFTNPANGEKNYIFGSGHVEKFAESNGIPLLGVIPLLEEISSGGDKGAPVAAQGPSTLAMVFDEVVVKVAGWFL